MSTKIETYSEMTNEAAKLLTHSIPEWKQWLRFQAGLYKYPYTDQISIYAQRPDATLCLDFDQWTQTMNRYIHKGSKGIGIVDNSGDAPKMRYVFDISDTSEKWNSRPISQWRFDEESMRDVVSDALTERYDIKQNNLDPDILIFKIARRESREYLKAYAKDLDDILAGSMMEEYDELNRERNLTNICADAISYLTYSRMGMNADTIMPDTDFINLFDLNTSKLIGFVGRAVNEISFEILKTVERTVKNFERSKQNDLHKQRGSVVSESDADRREEALGEIRTDEGEISKDQEGLDVRLSPAESDLEPTPEGDTGEGREDAEQTDIGIGNISNDSELTVKEWYLSAYPDDELGTQIKESISFGDVFDGLNNNKNVYELIGVGDSIVRERVFGKLADIMDIDYQQIYDMWLNGAKVRRNLDTEQLNLFGESIDLPNEAENSFETLFSASSVTDKDIERLLQLSCSNVDYDRIKIVSEFSKAKPMEDKVRFLKTVYVGGFGELKTNTSVAFDIDGMHIAKGDTAMKPGNTLVSWESMAERIDKMLNEGRFALQEDISKARPFERKDAAEKLWYMERDLSDEGKAMFTVFDKMNEKSGFPDQVGSLVDSLQNEYFVRDVSFQLSDFIAALNHNSDLLNFKKLHHVDQILERFNDMLLPRITYESKIAVDDMPDGHSFITEDEIANTIRGGSGVSEGKIRIAEFFDKNKDGKARADFLKDEYGIGGRSHAVSGCSGSGESHDAKGVVLKKPNCKDVVLSWSDMAKRIGKLISTDKYLSSDEKTKMAEDIEIKRQNAETTDERKAEITKSFEVLGYKSMRDYSYINSIAFGRDGNSKAEVFKTWNEAEAWINNLKSIVQPGRVTLTKGDVSEERVDILIDAMRIAGVEYDKIDSYDGYLKFNCEYGSIAYESWTEVEEWLDGTVFDDSEISDDIEKLLHPERFEKDIPDDAVARAKPSVMARLEAAKEKVKANEESKNPAPIKVQER